MQSKHIKVLFLFAMIFVIISGCSSKKAPSPSTPATSVTPSPTVSETPDTEKELKKIKVTLDWMPNTNHTGLYVAQAQGFYKNAGLEVEIIQPGNGGAEQMVASGEVPFGISYQETVTMSRLQHVPIVSIAAVIQHNTSGYAAPKDRGFQTPKDFEGKTYSGYGSATEEALLGSVMQSVDADVNEVKMISVGSGDFFTSTKKDIDFALIYYAWTGIQAELLNEPLDVFYLKDYSEALDFYTPVLITNEDLIDKDPELVRAFMKATSEGYQFAIENSEKAADDLLNAVPDLDRDLVVASQQWLATRYQDDAPRWGEQKLSVWENYANWMFENKLLDDKLDAPKAFTNDFLP